MPWRQLFLLCLVAACSSEPETPADPCAVKPVIAGGTVVLGLGTEFSPVTDGQDVELQLGLQGLWMFVVNARVRNMAIGSGGREGVLDVVALGPDGAQASLETGCRVREFGVSPGGDLQLSSPFLLPLHPSLTPALEGTEITIRLQVRDFEGRQATDERSVVARLPPQNP